MTLTIDVNDYLAEDKIREICREAIYDSICQKFTRREIDIDTMIINLGYEFIMEAVSRAIGEDAKARIQSEVSRLLQKEESLNYALWKRADPWGGKDSVAINIMNDAVRENSTLIHDLVKKQILAYDFSGIDDVMYEACKKVLYEQIFGKED